MKPYRNLGINSNVRAYEIGDTYLQVEFTTGVIHVYDENKPGPADLNKMKALAESGIGLGNYITGRIKDNFAHKI